MPAIAGVVIAFGDVRIRLRRDLAAASSFLTWMERRHASTRNPFRGTKARPLKAARRAAAELGTILDTLAPDAYAAAAVMAYRGLRVGALQSLTIRAGRFTARSKGKDISGTLPAEALAAIRAAGLDTKTPFAGTKGRRYEDMIREACLKLAAAGRIAAPYSARDFRHLYAVTEYRKNHDIYRVSKLLGHASIQVTELYLRGLGEVD
ncbi:MAG: hypothetical protein ABSF43_18125 [Rectinemataceae bacterium]